MYIYISLQRKKVKKEVTKNSRNQGFLTFLLLNGRILIRMVLNIRIRIHNAGYVTRFRIARESLAFFKNSFLTSVEAGHSTVVLSCAEGRRAGGTRARAHSVLSRRMVAVWAAAVAAGIQASISFLVFPVLQIRDPLWPLVRDPE
jgi:hypothetical protein